MFVRTSGGLYLCHFVRLMLQLEMMCGNLLNCVNWVSSFSKSIHSHYIRDLSVMQCPVILHFCVIFMVSIAMASL